jgi:hypothetical protein
VQTEHRKLLHKSRYHSSRKIRRFETGVQKLHELLSVSCGQDVCGEQGVEAGEVFRIVEIVLHDDQEQTLQGEDSVHSSCTHSCGKEICYNEGFLQVGNDVFRQVLQNELLLLWREGQREQ